MSFLLWMVPHKGSRARYVSAGGVIPAKYRSIRTKLYLFFQCPKFAEMKKIILVTLALILLASCNKTVCPAYSDSANDMKNTLFQKGNIRADGINRVYRDSYQKKLR